MTTETIRTETHEFYILPHRNAEDGYEARYQALNPKTAKPWQSIKRVEIGATITPEHWRRPIAYATVEAAREAVEAQKAKFAKRKGKGA
jgi:hypothetical protein